MNVDELVEMIVDMVDYQNNGDIEGKIINYLSIKECLCNNVDLIIQKLDNEREELATYNGHCENCGSELTFTETSDTEIVEYAGCSVRQPVYIIDCPNCGIINE